MTLCHSRKSSVSRNGADRAGRTVCQRPLGSRSHRTGLRQVTGGRRGDAVAADPQACAQAGELAGQAAGRGQRGGLQRGDDVGEPVPGLLAAGVRTPASYTVEQCLKDWLQTLNTQAEITVTAYRIMARHLTGLIGNVKLADLKVRDVQFALGTLAERLSSRSVRLAQMILIQAIRNAMVKTAAVALGPLFEAKGKTNGGQS